MFAARPRDGTNSDAAPNILFDELASVAKRAVPVRVVVFVRQLFAFRGKAFTSKIGIRAREFVPRL
jgi:hypothetical protein